MIEPGVVYSPLEIRRIRQVAELLSGIFRSLSKDIWLERSSMEIDKYVNREMSRLGLQPAMFGYRGFPASCCISPNATAVHGIPDERKIGRGDIFTLDIAAKKNGWMTDCAWTYVAPGASERAQRTVHAAWAVTRAVIAAVKPGRSIFELAKIAEATARDHCAHIIPQFAGHGIGRSLHEPPQLPFVTNGIAGDTSIVLREGNVVSIEPVITLGEPVVRPVGDGWGYRTADESPAAHFELIVHVHDTGARVLTFQGIPGTGLPEIPEFC